MAKTITGVIQTVTFTAYSTRHFVDILVDEPRLPEHGQLLRLSVYAEYAAELAPRCGRCAQFQVQMYPTPMPVDGVAADDRPVNGKAYRFWMA